MSVRVKLKPGAMSLKRSMSGAVYFCCHAPACTEPKAASNAGHEDWWRGEAVKSQTDNPWAWKTYVRCERIRTVVLAFIHDY